jgi:hypothetical protein
VRNDGSSAVFVVESVDTLTRVKVKRLNGSLPDFGATATTNVKLNWVQPLLKIGGGLNWDLGSASSFFSRPLLSMPPSHLTVVQSAEFEAPPAFFGAMTGSVADALAGFTRARCLEWGATASPDSNNSVAGNVSVNGFLLGDGGVVCSHLASSGFLSATTITATDVTVNTIVEVTPERAFRVREDFSSGIWDGSAFLYAENTWSAAGTGSPSVSIVAGTVKNPGQLRVSLPTNSLFHFELVGPTSDFLRFDQFDEFVAVLKIVDDPGNLATSVGVGLMQNAAAQNGGTDCIEVVYAPSDSHWRIMLRKASAQSFINIGTFVSNTQVVVRFKRDATTGNIAVLFNEVTATTILAANAPTGTCTVGGTFLSSVADAQPITANVDFIYVRGGTGARQGA